MAQVPTYIYWGDEQVIGGNLAIAPRTYDPLFWGKYRLLPMFERVVPSDATGVTGGTYEPYWDGLAGTEYTSTGATGNTIVATGAGWTVNEFVGRFVFVNGGPGAGEIKIVAANTSDTLTIVGAWTVNPTASRFHVGVGKFVKYHYRNSDVIPGARGDNWYSQFAEFTGAITPCTMLMQKLSGLHASSPGFRFLKMYTPGGHADARPGTFWWAYFKAYWDQMVAAMALVGDTPVVRAVISDHSTSDIAAGNVSYVQHLTEFIAGIRSEISADALILLVNQPATLLKTSQPGAAAQARTIHRLAELEILNQNVALYDMNWGKFAPDTLGSPVEPSNPRYYDPETYIQAGIGLFNAIQGFYTEAPPVADDEPLAGFAVIGDSQVATSGCDPLFAVNARVSSLLGPDPTELTNIMPGVWIWDDVQQDVLPYDVTANASNYGFPVGINWFGPELTMLRRLLKQYPNGILLFKYAQPGAHLTPEVGGPLVAMERGYGVFEDLKAKWAKARAACLSKMGRAVDFKGTLVSLGENDAGSDAAIAAFENRVALFADDLCAMLKTRADGLRPGLVWLQGPPPLTRVAGGSNYQTEDRRDAYRDAVAELATSRPRTRVLLNNGPDTYELSRVDGIHYSAEAVFRIGLDAAEALIAIDSDEGETQAAESASETAAFVAEDGSGLTNANSYCSVAFADSYFAEYSNPAAWRDASVAKKKNALREATAYLSRTYGYRWRGLVYSTSQSLDWPREGVLDGDDLLVYETDDMPRKLQVATCMVAKRVLAGVDLTPDVSPDDDRVLSMSMSSASGASVSKTFAGTRRSAPKFTEVEQILRPLLRDGSGSGWGYVEA